MSRRQQRMLMLLTAALLATVFVGYLRPGFIIDLTNQIWLCN